MDEVSAWLQKEPIRFSVGRLRVVFSRTILGPRLGLEIRCGSWRPEDGRFSLTLWCDRNRLTISFQERT